MRKKALFLACVMVTGLMSTYLEPGGGGRGRGVRGPRGLRGARVPGRRVGRPGIPGRRVRPGWRRPGWRRGLRQWGPGIAWSAGVGGTGRNIDFAGKDFWEITNNTPDIILVKSRRGYSGVRILPGETRSLGHPFSFRFTVESKFYSGTFGTREHFIRIELDNRGNLITNTWT